MNMRLGRALVIGGLLLALSGCRTSRHPGPAGQATSATATEVEVEQLAKSPADYAGKPVRLRGVVASTAIGQRMFTVIDVAEYKSCGELDCAGYEVPVSFAGALPETARTVRITGRLEQPEPGHFVLRAANVDPLP